jgi:hypothetical protein
MVALSQVGVCVVFAGELMLLKLGHIEGNGRAVELYCLSSSGK